MRVKSSKLLRLKFIEFINQCQFLILTGDLRLPRSRQRHSMIQKMEKTGSIINHHEHVPIPIHVSHNENENDEKNLCIICLSAHISVLPSGCGHFCMCAQCANHPDMKQCPVCRKEYTKHQLVKVFTM